MIVFTLEHAFGEDESFIFMLLLGGVLHPPLCDGGLCTLTLKGQLWATRAAGGRAGCRGLV